MIYQTADANDQDAIRSLLQRCNLPHNDLQKHLTHFIVAKQKEKIVGCIGMERQGPLLRSLAVDPEYRNQGIATNLCKRLLAHASNEGADEIYLLTDSASDFFNKFGFRRKKREQAPVTIRTHKQFTELCPESAILMSKKLND